MVPMRSHLLPIAGALSLTVACGSPFAGGDCSAVGAINGVSVDIPTQLSVETGSLTVAVCDDQGCESATRPLGKLPADVPVPVGRGGVVTFKQLG